MEEVTECRGSAGTSSSSAATVMGSAAAREGSRSFTTATDARCRAADVSTSAAGHAGSHQHGGASGDGCGAGWAGGGGGGDGGSFAAHSSGEEHFYGHMLAGALAGTTEHCAMFPLDTIKTRMQTAVTGAGARAASGAAANAALHASSTTAALWGDAATRQTRPAVAAVGGAMRDVVRSLMRTEGIAGLYRGVAAVGIGAGPAHALYFATYEYAKDALGGGQPVGIVFCTRREIATNGHCTQHTPHKPHGSPFTSKPSLGTTRRAW